jgi:hypothetical protein
VEFGGLVQVDNVSVIYDFEHRCGVIGEWVVTICNPTVLCVVVGGFNAYLEEARCILEMSLPLLTCA